MPKAKIKGKNARAKIYTKKRLCERLKEKTGARKNLYKKEIM